MEPTRPKSPQATAETPSATSPAVPEAPQTTERPPLILDTGPQYYYQALGWLRGTLLQEEEKFYIRIRDVNFTLFIPRRILSAAKKLEGQMAWVKCYPQSKGEGLCFKVVWIDKEQKEEGSEAGMFVLRGVWQFIPQCRRPVFSIYRNALKDFETRPHNQHLPLIWSDQPPFRFRKDSEERPKFCQIMARLIPQRACFGFVAQIADPIDQTPRRVKKVPPTGGPGGEKKFVKGEKGDKGEKKERPERKAKPENKEKVEGLATEEKALASQVSAVETPTPEVQPASAAIASPDVTSPDATKPDVTPAPENAPEAVIPEAATVQTPVEAVEVKTEPVVEEAPAKKRATKGTKKTTKAAPEPAPETPEPPVDTVTEAVVPDPDPAEEAIPEKKTKATKTTKTTTAKTTTTRKKTTTTRTKKTAASDDAET